MRREERQVTESGEEKGEVPEAFPTAGKCKGGRGEGGYGERRAYYNRSKTRVEKTRSETH